MSLAGNCFCKILQLCVYVYVYIYTCCSLPVNRVVFLRPAGGGQFLGSGNHRPLFSTMRLVSTRLVIGCVPKMHVSWWAIFFIQEFYRHPKGWTLSLPLPSGQPTELN